MPAREAVKSIGSGVLETIRAMQPQHRMPLWLFWCALLMLAFEFAQVSWQLIERTMPQVSGAPQTLSTSVAAGSVSPPLGAIISARHLFGESKNAAASSALPMSNVSMILKGVFASGGGRGSAIIDDGTRQSYYIIGDVVGAAVLRKVYRDHVVLERGGRFEVLPMPKNELPPPPSAALAEMAGAGPANYNTPDNGRLLKQYQSALHNEPQSLIGLLATTPVTENGRAVGVRLGAGQDPMLLTRFGLQSGDVVTSLNGAPLDGQKSGMDVLKGLATAQSLSVSLLRNGQPMTLQYQVNDVK